MSVVWFRERRGAARCRKSACHSSRFPFSPLRRWPNSSPEPPFPEVISTCGCAMNRARSTRTRNSPASIPRPDCPPSGQAKQPEQALSDRMLGHSAQNAVPYAHIPGEPRFGRVAFGDRKLRFALELFADASLRPAIHHGEAGGGSSTDETIKVRHLPVNIGLTAGATRRPRRLAPSPCGGPCLPPEAAWRRGPCSGQACCRRGRGKGRRHRWSRCRAGR